MGDLVGLFADACGAPVPLLVLLAIALRQERVYARLGAEVSALDRRIKRLEWHFN